MWCLRRRRGRRRKREEEEEETREPETERSGLDGESSRTKVLIP